MAEKCKGGPNIGDARDRLIQKLKALGQYIGLTIFAVHELLKYPVSQFRLVPDNVGTHAAVHSTYYVYMIY